MEWWQDPTYWPHIAGAGAGGIIAYLIAKEDNPDVFKGFRGQNLTIFDLARSYRYYGMWKWIVIAFCSVYSLGREEFAVGLYFMAFWGLMGGCAAARVRELLEQVETASVVQSSPSAAYVDEEEFVTAESGQGDDFDIDDLINGLKRPRREGSPHGTRRITPAPAPASMPYGFDKRHPDDAKFWAHADDPNNPPHVRKAWFKKALEREESRRKKQTPDHVKRALPRS